VIRPYNCWISPEGEIIKVGLWQHATDALEIIKDKYHVDVVFGSYAVEYLHNHNWARIHMVSEVSPAQCVCWKPVTTAILNAVASVYAETGFTELREYLEEQGYEMNNEGEEK
jgi:hypothetical protein